MAGIVCSLRVLANNQNETGAGGGERQNAEALRLFPHKTDGTRISPRIQARANTEIDARARRVRREIHDRLPERISSELVQAGEAFAGSGARVAQLFWRECVATFIRMAAQRLDSSRRPARLVPALKNVRTHAQPSKRTSERFRVENLPPCEDVRHPTASRKPIGLRLTD